MKHRGQRGILTSKIKDAMFNVFKKDLPQISTNSSSSDIARWKRNPSLRRCRENLYRTLDDNDSITYIMSIVERVFVKEATDTQIAYTISVCEYLLDPENESIQVTESTVRDKFEEVLVSFAILRR